MKTMYYTIIVPVIFFKKNDSETNTKSSSVPNVTYFRFSNIGTSTSSGSVRGKRTRSESEEPTPRVPLSLVFQQQQQVSLAAGCKSRRLC